MGSLVRKVSTCQHTAERFRQGMSSPSELTYSTHIVSWEEGTQGNHWNLWEHVSGSN